MPQNVFEVAMRRSDLLLAILGAPAYGIVSGGARGADAAAAKYAAARNLPLKEYLPDEARKDPGRYHERNRLIVKHSDVLLAFWDEKSPGTRSTVGAARAKGIAIYVAKLGLEDRRPGMPLPFDQPSPCAPLPHHVPEFATMHDAVMQPNYVADFCEQNRDAMAHFGKLITEHRDKGRPNMPGRYCDSSSMPYVGDDPVFLFCDIVQMIYDELHRTDPAGSPTIRSPYVKRNGEKIIFVHTYRYIANKLMGF